MGNPTYTPPERAQDSTGPLVTTVGFRWRLDGREKVLLYGGDPLGSVGANVWHGRKMFPFCALRHYGGFRSENFATEREAIAWVKATMPAYLEHRAYLAANPPRRTDCYTIQPHREARRE